MKEAGKECSMGRKQETGVTEAKGLKREQRGGDKGRWGRGRGQCGQILQIRSLQLVSALDWEN